MEEDMTLEELSDKKSERRARTPERNPPVKRRSEVENDAMGHENRGKIRICTTIRTTRKHGATQSLSHVAARFCLNQSLSYNERAVRRSNSDVSAHEQDPRARRPEEQR